MNRIRKINDSKYQVLTNHRLRMLPDSPLYIGNIDDPDLMNYQLIETSNLNDALAESYKYKDIDWKKIIDHHKYIFLRLKKLIQSIIDNYDLEVTFNPIYIDEDSFKNNVFERVEKYKNNTNFRFENLDIIELDIVNPWTQNLQYIAEILTKHRHYLYRDDLRLYYKQVIKGKMIYLYGKTELGTNYKIKLIPTLLYQWLSWYHKGGFMQGEASQRLFDNLYKQQIELDRGSVIR